MAFWENPIFKIPSKFWRKNGNLQARKIKPLWSLFIIHSVEVVYLSISFSTIQLKLSIYCLLRHKTSTLSIINKLICSQFFHQKHQVATEIEKWNFWARPRRLLILLYKFNIRQSYMTPWKWNYRCVLQHLLLVQIQKVWACLLATLKVSGSNLTGSMVFHPKNLPL